MDKICIVVADAGIAKVYGVERIDSPRVQPALVELAQLTNESDLKVLGSSVTGRVRTETNTNRGSGPVHPMGAQRERHRVELERRFGMELVKQMIALTGGWKRGTVVLIAAPHLLGLMREPMRRVLHDGIALKELAKDYTHMGADELRERLIQDHLLPAPGPAAGN